MHQILIYQICSDDLPSLLHFNDDVIRWKSRWTASEVSTRPDTIAKALKKWDDETYPNLLVLLKIASTVTVTSCKCVRSGCKRLNTYLRASMEQERMSGLAFIHINMEITTKGMATPKIPLINLMTTIYFTIFL